MGVVLAAGEQEPEQARELARARDDGDPVSTAGTQALVEGVLRAGLANGAPGRLDQRPARRCGALL